MVRSGHGRSPERAVILGSCHSRNHADRRCAPPPDRSPHAARASSLVVLIASRWSARARQRRRRSGRPGRRPDRRRPTPARDRPGTVSTPAPTPPPRTDRPRRHRHVLRPRLRPRRRACPSTARVAGRSPARTPRRSSPTTTRARRSARSRPRARSASGSCSTWEATAAVPLDRLRPARRRGPSTASPATFPADADAAADPDDHGHGDVADDVAAAGRLARTARSCMTGPKPASVVVRGTAATQPARSSGRSPSSYDQYRGRAAAARVRRPTPTVTVVNELRARDRTCAAWSRSRCRRRWPAAALQAQAIAARSYAARRLRPGVSYYDVADDTALAGLPRRARREGGHERAIVATSAGVVLRSGSSIANTLFHSTGGGATENNENVYTSSTGAKVAGAGQLPARIVGPDAPTGRRTTRRRPYATWPTRTYTRAQLSAWFAADPRTAVGTLTALDLRDRGVLRPARSASRSSARRARRRSRARSSAPSSTRAARRRSDAPQHAVRRSRRSPDAGYRGAMIEPRPRCAWAGADRPVAGPADGRVPRRRVGHAGRTTTSSSSSGSRSSRSRPACRGRRSCASARRSARRSAASIRGSWRPSATDDRARLMADAGIVRNGAKIDATIGNAAAFLATADEFGSFDAYLGARSCRRRPPACPATRGAGEIPATTPASDALSADLRRARVPVRRLDDRVRVHAERRPGRRPPAGLLPLSRRMTR